ncbi:Uncharacterized protein dnl_61210 [Desulfonema limicola]|uniref:Uncharacterized protein n=1 Tax=Desulfonema limicola TaxID=45656 RepID=A0A975BE67_9BACT|nr:hypothetical protein [Desulfonema limicola]QTA83706.1 Uncharacterized protein dnl_61210 [Desulfonema limicola]
MKQFYVKIFRPYICNIINILSFNNRIRDLADILNRKVENIEDASDSQFSYLISHPGGFLRAFHKRRMNMAESYVRIAQQLDRSNYKERLHALKVMMVLSLHAKTVSMPLNTARVQIEIMKEAVKNLHNPRRQMEMIADFSVASYGREAAIRRFLRELKRVEVPENGKPFKELDLGWDSHVHDNLSEGRKTPSQLILDAFIKGISRLTLAYYDIPDRDIVFEAMKAGKILGIEVSIGIEFSVGLRSRRKHYLYVVPALTYQAFTDYFNDNCRALTPFVDGLEENRKRRRRVITEILENFNKTHRIELNRGYPENGILALKPLRFEYLEKIVPNGQYSRNHLSELLYEQLKGLLKKRVLALKVQHEIFRQLFQKGEVTGWEIERIEESYLKTREKYHNLTPAHLKSDFFSGKNITDYDSAFPSEDHILPDLKAVGGQIVFSRPLEHGLNEAVSSVFYSYSDIDMIELMNMRDSMVRDPSEITRLCRFIDLLNNGTREELKLFLKDWEIKIPDQDIFTSAFETYHDKALIPLAVSASTGWKPQIPGMGFIKDSSIPKKSLKYFSKTHYQLPQSVSSLIAGKGRPFEKPVKIYSLGKRGHFKPNLVGDEQCFESVSPMRLWRYLNPVVKNIIRITLGIIPAYLWIGAEYAVIWFGITFFRNLFVDLIAFSGAKPGVWSLKNVDFDNIAQSLFWTGFSVPVLGSVKNGFDMAWPFAATGLFFEWSKFLFICIANGIYISTHNKIRQFDNRVIRANFFRSILAWPFSAVFAPAGNLLMIPSIVQAKFWSDVIAAIIEGTNKFHQKIILRKRDILEILPLLESETREVRLTAMLDILYIWAKRQRGYTSLLHILKGNKGFLGKITGKIKQKNKDEKKDDPVPEYLPLMIKLFKPQDAQFELSRFILENYTSREEIVLTELLNTYLVSFHQWMEKLIDN